MADGARCRSAITTLGLACALGLPAGVAQAALPPVKLPRVQVPAPVVRDLAESSATNHYAADPAAVAALDEAARGVRDGADRLAARVGADAESRASIRQCAGAGLQSAGESYHATIAEAAAIGAAPPLPDHEQAISAASGCLQEHFPDSAPEELVDLGEHLVAQAFARAHDVTAADDSAVVLANWMTITGDDLATAGTGEATFDPAPRASGGGEAPWGIAIGVVVILVLGGIAVGTSRRGGAV
jgi:hypothetical protein